MAFERNEQLLLVIRRKNFSPSVSAQNLISIFLGFTRSQLSRPETNLFKNLKQDVTSASSLPRSDNVLVAYAT